MSDIKFYEMDFDEAHNLMKKKRNEGWIYDENVDELPDVVVSNRNVLYSIQNSSGQRIASWTLEECIAKISEPLSFSDIEQKRALEAFEFFNILFNTQYQDRKPLKRLGLL